MQIAVYTDGGCSGNPGRGAWAFVVVDPAARSTLAARSGSHSHTTNNRMELQAVIQALDTVRRTRADAAVSLYTDSKYVQKGITEWIYNWMKNNWRSASKKPIKNVELWQALYRVQQGITIEWCWVKGHDNNWYNERCHDMVQQEIAKC